MSQEMTDVQRLVFVRKVAGYANLGVFPCPVVLQQAIDHVTVLERNFADQDMNLGEVSRPLQAMRQNVLPSQMMCQAGMQCVDRWLRPLRAEARDSARQSESGARLAPRAT